jgi:HNH endonuclease
MLTQEYLKEILNCDPETGIIIWKINKRGRGAKIGKLAGHINDSGYSVIMINRKYYRAHHLIWLYVHGVLPEKELDHINRIRNDNRISNLREATRSQNARNSIGHKDSHSGIKGVRKIVDKWHVRVMINRKAVFVGSFSTKEEAINAHSQALLEIHKEFACLTKV